VKIHEREPDTLMNFEAIELRPKNRVLYDVQKFENVSENWFYFKILQHFSIFFLKILKISEIIKQKCQKCQYFQRYGKFQKN